eukprot:365233-Chlamydomonas_euryale.AAC.2
MITSGVIAASRVPGVRATERLTTVSLLHAGAASMLAYLEQLCHDCPIAPALSVGVRQHSGQAC